MQGRQVRQIIINQLPKLAIAIIILQWCSLFLASSTNALQLGPSLGRRDVLQNAAFGYWTSSLIADSSVEDGSISYSDDIRRAFRSNDIDWNASDDWSRMRYGTSSLSDRERIPSTNRATLPPVPTWMEGQWLCTYKFDRASFPQGRDKLSLTVPGAGLGTCVALPNVGYNPAPFVQRFAGNRNAAAATSTGSPAVVVEDVAYNLPRKLEAFWPQAKVSSVRVSVTDGGHKRALSPTCFVTGEGCSADENPRLHGEFATRCLLEFRGPTRRGGSTVQEMDVSMVEATTSGSVTDDEFLASRAFVQYNVQQELTCYYVEYLSFVKQPQGGLKGRTRVAAFLPPSLRAVAVYDYTMKYEEIDSSEASTY